MKKDDQGSDYFASMTDMMVGILFLFVIMIAYFALKISSAESVPKPLYDQQVAANKALQVVIADLNAAIEKLKKEIEALKKPSPLETYIQAGQAARNGLVSKVIEKLNKAGIDARSVQQGVVTISGKGLFGTGASDLDSLPDARLRVDVIALVLNDALSCFALKSTFEATHYTSCNPDKVFIDTVFVEGHTDNIPVTSQLKDGSVNNLELSSRRATNTYQELIEHIPELTSYVSEFDGRDRQVLSVAAYGEQRPIADNSTPTGREENRRIDIRFEMKVPRSLDELNRFTAKFEH